MRLQWRPDPAQANKRVATSPAYHYVLLELADGQGALHVRHRGDRPSAPTIKDFTYKSPKAAQNGAQRFEDKHGYADPAHFAPAAVVPFLRPFSAQVKQLIKEAQQHAQGTAAVPSAVGDISTYVEMATEAYDELCTELLCCRLYDCYNRTEPGAMHCDEHQTDDTTEE